MANGNGNATPTPTASPLKEKASLLDSLDDGTGGTPAGTGDESSMKKSYMKNPTTKPAVVATRTPPPARPTMSHFTTALYPSTSPPLQHHAKSRGQRRERGERGDHSHSRKSTFLRQHDGDGPPSWINVKGWKDTYEEEQAEQAWKENEAEQAWKEDYVHAENGSQPPTPRKNKTCEV